MVGRSRFSSSLLLVTKSLPHRTVSQTEQNQAQWLLNNSQRPKFTHSTSQVQNRQINRLYHSSVSDTVLETKEGKIRNNKGTEPPIKTSIGD